LIDQEALRMVVEQLQNGIAADAAAARTAIQRAEDLRGQGDAGYQAGQAFVTEKRYDEALKEYQTASARYRESLDFQENAAARKRITELSDLILDVEKDANANALAQVSKLIDDAKALQKQSKYADAVAKLEEAKQLWTTVNPTETNNVLELNLLMAQSALKQSGRREITRTDPIYQDVRGFMLQAELSYSAADRLKKTAPTSEEYRQNLETARKSVEAITTAVPEYREARLMDLKIERLEKGEAAFSASLLQRIQEALAKTKDARATEDTLRKTRLSLLDYKEIEGYTSIVTRTTRGQIDTAIVDLEVRLGMRVAPVPAALITLSKSRYQEALTRYRAHRNDQTYWDSVLGLLRESTNANPENTDASGLYYEIAARRGSVESLLTQNDEAQWRVAINAFSNKDYPRAEAIVDELLAKKPKQPGLLKLKAQIQIARGL
jgi:tetratricopeptide (TPR) repeat protein